MIDMSGVDPLDRERFLALLSSYSRAYERFLENGFKTGAALLVVLGWLIGSNGVENFFKQNQVALGFAIFMMCTAAFFLVATFTRLRAISRKLRRNLDDLCFIESKYYEQHEIAQTIYWSVVGQNFLLCILIISVLVSFFVAEALQGAQVLSAAR